MKTKFTICSPPYTDKSAGIWILHFLCDRLNHLGYPATINTMINPSSIVNPKFHTPLSYDPDSIVVYPEIVLGNPLGADKVVRYLLCHELVPINWGELDFPLSYSKVFRDDCDILYYPIADLDLFYSDGRKREGYCVYRGKSFYTGPLPISDNSVEITRSWPESKHELAEILRSKQFLFTLDNITSTALDAALCGCVPLYSEPAYESGELGKFWMNDISELSEMQIEVTALHEKVRVLQNSFDERLETIVHKILRHFV